MELKLNKHPCENAWKDFIFIIGVAGNRITSIANPCFKPLTKDFLVPSMLVRKKDTFFLIGNGSHYITNKKRLKVKTLLRRFFIL